MLTWYVNKNILEKKFTVISTGVLTLNTQDKYGLVDFYHYTRFCILSFYFLIDFVTNRSTGLHCLSNTSYNGFK